MDNSLFEKYKKVINKQEVEKERIINLIKEKTGIVLKEKQIVLDENKKVTIFVSSIQKNIFKLKNVSDFLKKEGFLLN